MPGIYYYSMPMQTPVALSFDLVKKDRKTISASAASEKLKRLNESPHQVLETELRELKATTSEAAAESSDNVELDSEGRVGQNADVIKKSFEFGTFKVTVQARAIKMGGHTHAIQSFENIKKSILDQPVEN